MDTHPTENARLRTVHGAKDAARSAFRETADEQGLVIVEDDGRRLLWRFEDGLDDQAPLIEMSFLTRAEAVIAVASQDVEIPVVLDKSHTCAARVPGTVASGEFCRVAESCADCPVKLLSPTFSARFFQAFMAPVEAAA